MTTSEVTQLLQKWSYGEAAAFNSLTPVVYDELRRLAAIYLHRERAGHTPQATAVVHETYIRLVDQRSAWPRASSRKWATAPPASFGGTDAAGMLTRMGRISGRRCQRNGCGSASG